MPMPAEYHELHKHENYALGGFQDNSNMTANMYRVGDYVYFETSSTSPYQIRRIEELNKTASGNVEAKVMCFFRRRDLPSTLVMLADKHQLATAAEQQRSNSPAGGGHCKPPADSGPEGGLAKDPVSTGNATKVPMNKHQAAAGGGTKGPWLKTAQAEAHEPHGLEDVPGVGGGGGGGGGGGASSGPVPNLGPGIGGLIELSPKQRHQMKHRELFLSRQVETMPATHIRGKCCVTLLNETESLLSYLNKDDSFFYCLVFDPAQRTLLADKGEIRVGSRYQADNIAPAPLTQAEREAEPRKLQDLETLIWTPRHSLTDRQIDQFLVVSRSVGTFARALDCSSSVKQPSLHMSAAAASRDITLFHAMDTLHRHNYDVAKAMSSLVPSSGPVLCRDEMEEWSASEANLFEEALDKYGKDFSDIRSDFVPWKTLKNVIEYYYMWKTTDRYVQQKRVKAVEAESKLKQVYIPNYNKGGSGGPGTNTSGGAQIIPLGNSNGAKVNILNGSSNGADAAMLLVQGNGKPCEGCQTSQSGQWYAWGPSHMQCRLCQGCWNYWKKYGGLKVPSRIDDSGADERKRSGGAVTPGSNSGGLATTPTGVAPGSGAGSDDESGGKPGAPSRPHRCGMPSCGKEFKLKAHLSRHYASAHGVELRAGTPGSGAPPLPGAPGASPILSSVVAAAAGMPLAAAALGLGGAAAVAGVLPGGGSPRPVMKTRSAFYLRTSSLARAARRLCAAQLRVRHAARAPHQPVNAAPLRHLCASPQLASKTPAELRVLARTVRPRARPRVTDIASRLGRIEAQPAQPGEWDWLQLTPPSQRKPPDHVSFPRPPKAPDGSLLYERVPNKPELERVPAAVTPPVAGAVVAAATAGGPVPPVVVAQQQGQPQQLVATGVALKRPRPPQFDEQSNGGSGAAATATDGVLTGQVGHPPMKRSHHGGGPSLNGRALHPVQGPMSRSNARKQVMSWMDAPDDVYFRSTDHTKRFRRSLSSVELRRAARKPWRKLNVPQRATRPDDLVVILD